MVNVVSLAEIIVSFIAIYYILTVALNIKAGMTGIPDFGHAMFFAIGGIVVANFAARIAAAFVASQLGVSPGEAMHLVIAENTAIMVKINEALATRPLLSIMLIIFSIVVALLLGGLLGWIASYPALRLRGDYLAIMLLTASEGLRIFVMYTKSIMGSTPTVGLTTPALFAFTGDAGLWSTVFVASLAVIVYLFAERFHNSPSGRLFRAVRDDEDSAEAVGKNIAKVRRDAMIIGSAIAALAGVAYSFSTWIAGSSIAAQSIFDRVLWTFWPWALMILGGMSSNRGITLATIVVGALIVGPIRIYKNQIAAALPVDKLGFDPGNFASALEFTLVALLILLVLLFRPKGVIPEPPSYTLKPSELKELVKEAGEQLELSEEGQQS
ncbi:MAG: branched-chain amino acid ABC transporter permease [Desulfurococcales archaeon]|nr:branched-chain amino acid ABC transporter permease [Desulfurococcales archaeon]MCE4629709.1 branched-chain amino acid ABC transporter permease [Desulfurococcales archaeon]